MRKDSWQAGRGPLVPFAEGFGAWLVGEGHPQGSLKHYLLLTGELDRWLLVEGLGSKDLTTAVAGGFLEWRQAARGGRVFTLASLAPLLEYLEAAGVVVLEPEPEPTPLDVLLVDYRRYLVDDRGLAATSVRRYGNFAKRFLAGRAARMGAPTGAEGLTSAEVNAFMLEVAGRLVVESAKREAADLRSLLRYLYVSGVIEVDLGTAMPPVACWRGTALPPTMSTADVDRMLASCDRSTPSGRRDLAVLVLLARLGLRSGEVAALELDDIDWRTGEIGRAGKGPTARSSPVAGRCRRGDRRVPARRSPGVRLPPADPDALRAMASDPPELDHQTSCIGRAGGPGLPGWAGIGCATLWPPRCSARAAICWRSPRSCASPTWAPRPGMPRSTGPLCEASPVRGRGQPHELPAPPPG